MKKELNLDDVLNFFPDLKDVISDTSSKKLVRKAVSADITESGDVFDIIISTQTIDRDGEVLVTAGINYDYYNSVILFNHRLDSLPIGKMVEMHRTPGVLTGKVTFASDYGFASDVAKLVKGKFLQGVSIGFIPTKSIGKRDPGFAEMCKAYAIDPAKCTRIILACEMIECSIVPIPCNKTCMVKAIKPQLDTEDGARLMEKLEAKSVDMENPEPEDPAMERIAALEKMVEDLKALMVPPSPEPGPALPEAEGCKPQDEEPKSVEVTVEIEEPVVETPDPLIVEEPVVPVTPIDPEAEVMVPMVEEPVTEPTPGPAPVEGEGVTAPIDEPNPITIKVLRLGGPGVTTEIRRKAQLFLQGKSFK